MIEESLTSLDPRVAEFALHYDFQLDDYQLEGCQELASGGGVLVAAPTGAGKTIVGEFAVWLAINESRKCFYTTPIKALSNQKYHDLVETYGHETVGLLTGDSSVNPDAQIVVMTTEVLRNMIYAGSPTLSNLAYVIMDEVHYLADRFRGAVWEEVILGLREDVAIVALSATVSNVEDFGDWLRTVRGEFAVVVSERRPVPLYQHVLVGKKLTNLFEDVAPTAQELPSQRRARVNRELLNVSKNEAFRVRDDARRPRGRSGRGKSQSKHRRGSGDFGGATHPRFATRPIRRADMARVLQRNRLLPAICFIFSRVGCDAAVEQVRNSGVVLTSREEATQLGRIADRHLSALSYDDLEALGYENFREALCSGVAAHHAGQLPVFKAIVEEGFVLGALKLVFATETLALGINMPARTVVLEKLIKYNGESHVDITPGEYTQLTGRAGRRGIDVEGHAVVLWQSGMDPRAVAGLASNRTYPLRSSFAPSYNMAVNLTAILGRRAARELLNQSFAQFQTDKSVVKAARSGKRMAEELEQAHETLQCHLGDFMEYARMRDEISSLESTSASNRRAQWNEQVTTAIRKLVPGDVIHVRKQGWCVVLRVSTRQGTCQVISGDHTVLNLRPHDLASFPEPVTRIRVPKGFDLRDRKARRSLLAAMFQRLEQIDAVEPEPHSIPTDEQQQRRIAELRRLLRQHPCHECEDRELHAVAAANLIRLERQTAQTEAKIASRTNSLAFQFDSVCAILSELGYVDGDQLTGAGRMLRRIYNELDLVAAECIQQDVFAGLDAPQLAAVLSTLLYESRPGRDLRPPRMPDAASEYAQSQLRDVWRQVGRLERQHRRERSREPDIGFAETAWRWASGQDLAKVMRHSELAPGDFVRWVRQVIDLAGQLAQAAGPGDLGRTCRQVIASMRRGVVAAEVDED